MTLLDDLVLETREFAGRRDWFVHHSPKNLAMAITAEAGELASEYRGLSIASSSREQLSAGQLRDIRLEMADVFIFLLRLGDVLEVDLDAAVREKLAVNEDRFPADRNDGQK